MHTNWRFGYCAAMVMYCGACNQHHDTNISREYPAAWTVAPTPLTHVGNDPADTVLLFGHVTAVRLVGTSILVAHTIPPWRIFVLALDGQFQRMLGRDGDGPGELRSVLQMWVAEPDTAIAYDPAGSRMVYYRLNGTVLRTVQFSQQLSVAESRTTVTAMGRFADDTYLVEPNRLFGPPKPGWTKWPAERRYADGSVADTLGVFPHREWLLSRTGEFVRPLLGHSRGIALAEGDYYYVMRGDSFLIDVFSVNGELTRQFSRPFLARPITEEVLSSYRQWRLGRSPTPAHARRTRQDLASRPVPTMLPASSGRLLVGADGTVWVENYQEPWVTTGDVWSVFLRDGAFRGEVQLPIGFRLYDVGNALIAGVHRDANDVESVAVYNLREPQQ